MKEKLIKLLNNSYAPYSKYHVSAILTTKDGKEYKGVNIENASYGGTICAERVAINSAIANGETKDNFDKLYIMNSSDMLGFPCMICRQTFVELLPLTLEVIIYNIKGEERALTVKELCPYPFDKDSLL